MVRRHPPLGHGVGVVVGEDADHGRGVLRSILESEGFTVLGQASTSHDLERLLISTNPDVLVLDAQAGATTVLAARELAPQVRIVVVWPAAVRAEGADQHVLPAEAATALGAAVLMAARSYRMPSAIPVPIPVPVAVPAVSMIPDGGAAVSETEAAPEADGSAATPDRRAWASFALAAAALVVAFVAASTIQLPRSGFLAEPSVAPPVIEHPVGGDGSGGGGSPGNAGNQHAQPPQPPGATRPPRVQAQPDQGIVFGVGTVPPAGTSDGTTTSSRGGSAVDRGVRDRNVQRRHHRRHQRRHRRRRLDHGTDQARPGAHPTHPGHPSDHGSSDHSNPPSHPVHPTHPDHSEAEHGDSGHHGNPHD